MQLTLSRSRWTSVLGMLGALASAALPASIPGGAQAAAAQAQEPMDRRFLRMMSDHHEGLIQMGRQAAQRAENAQVKALAQRLADEQAREQQEMLRMLRQHYGETHTPMVMPENRVQIEQLSRYQGAEYDREFLQLTIHHHNDGVMMIHLMRREFRRRDVRAMANRMEDAQMREVREMKQMLGWPVEMVDMMIRMMQMHRS